MVQTEFSQWASAPASWITSGGNSVQNIVISSRIRIARNLTPYAFPHNSSIRVQNQTLQEILQSLKTIPMLKTSSTFFLKSFSAIERSFLMERQLISHQHAQETGEKGLVVTSGEKVSIMVNEEDHIRAAGFQPGLALEESWEIISGLDDEIGSQIPIAYDEKFGYVTACPTNVGTGLRASCLLHLPALGLMGKLPSVLKKLQNMGVAIRGFYGEGTSSLGDLFQISNAKSLGLSEEEIITSVYRVVKQVSDMELKAQENLLESGKRLHIEDKIYRSLGTLKTARLLNFNEGMHHLSMVRLGQRINLAIPLNILDITNLFFLVQPAHLIIRSGNDKSTALIEEELRAEYLKKRLND